MHRVTHVITSECDISVETTGTEVRIRFSEKDTGQHQPTCFEIEGDPRHIAEALATAASVLVHIKELKREDPH